MTEKKILIVHTSTKISGAEISLLHCLYNLLQSTYTIHIILPDKNELYHKLKNQFYVKVFAVHKFNKSYNFLHIIRSLINIIIQAIKISSYVRKHNIDILYSNSMYAQVYCIFIKVFSNRKLIWHVRDNVSGLVSKLVFPSLSNKIICVSDYISGQINSSLKKETIHNGLNISECLPEKHIGGSLKNSLNLESDIKLIAQIGQMVEWKNHVDFIKAAKLIIPKYNKVHFLFVGTDLFGNNSDYINSLKKIVEKEGLNKFITFVGYIENIKDVFQQIDILIHPALSEPFGRVLIEAMAMEKPVIAYNIGGAKEIIRHEIDGFLVEPMKYNAIAAQCVQLLENQKLCNNIGTNARETVVSKFNIQHTTRKLETVFDNLN